MSVGSILKSIKSEREENTAEQENPEPVNWFHGEDPLREERSKLERMGQLSFPEEWESEPKFQKGEKALIEQKIQEIEDNLSDLGYKFPSYTQKNVEIQHKKESPSKHLGRYDSRSNLGLGVPLHRINPDFENFDSGVLAPILHEHGHDVHSELIEEQIDDERLFEETLNEFVAELTMIEYMSEGYQDSYTRDPHSGYRRGFEGLSKAFDSSLRQQELSLIEEMNHEIQENPDYEKLDSLAIDLNSISPETGDFQYGPSSDLGMRTNMFLQNFIVSEQGDTVQDMIETKRNVKKMIDYRKWQEDPSGCGLLGDWNDNNFGPDSGVNSSKRWRRNIGRGIEEYLLRTNEEYRQIAQEMAEIEEDSQVKVMSKGYGWKNSWDWGGPGDERWRMLQEQRNKLGAEIIIGNKKDISEYMIERKLESLQRMTEEYADSVEGLEFESKHKAQYLIDNVANSGIRYGYEDGDWDEWFDFPHEVGCGMAHRLYEDEDVELREVVENPQQYLEKCKNEIYEVMETRIENPEGLPDEENPYV